MSLVITGSTGFIGRHLKAYMHDKGINLIEVNRGQKGNGVSFSDLSKQSISGTHWVHLAGMSKDQSIKNASDAYYEANVVLTQNVFNAFLADDSAEMFIFFSSMKAVAAQPVKELTENDKERIDPPYGTSKRQAEEWLLNQSIPNNKKLIILRPSMVYGKHTEGNLYSLFKFVKKGIPYPFGAFEGQKNLLSVDNLLFVLDKLIESNTIESGIYNVTDTETIGMDEIVNLMYRHCGMKNRSLAIPVSFFTTLAKIGDTLHLPFNSMVLNKLTGSYRVSNRKLLEALKIALPYKTTEKLDETVAWFQSEST
jgi:nucleoside-diphosphate-sugar epimerase